MKLVRVIATAAIAGGLSAGAIVGATSAAAAPGAPPIPTDNFVVPAGPAPGTPPAWAPPKPVDPAWSGGAPQIWDTGWQHWGVWLPTGGFVFTF